MTTNVSVIEWSNSNNWTGRAGRKDRPAAWIALDKNSGKFHDKNILTIFDVVLIFIENKKKDPWIQLDKVASMTCNQLISRKSNYDRKTEISLDLFQAWFQKNDRIGGLAAKSNQFKTDLRIEIASSPEKLNCHHLWESILWD